VRTPSATAAAAAASVGLRHNGTSPARSDELLRHALSSLIAITAAAASTASSLGPKPLIHCCNYSAQKNDCKYISLRNHFTKKYAIPHTWMTALDSHGSVHSVLWIFEKLLIW